MSAPEMSPTSSHVHEWFELTYSNYLVLPRVLMQSMPVEWQARMVTCLRQLDQAFDHVEKAPSYKVEPVEWSYLDDLSAAQMTALGIGAPDPDDEDDSGNYYDRYGNERDTNTACVPVPVREPLPHYRHSYVEPGPYDAEVEL